MTNRLNNDVPFDVLGDVLETLRFRGSIFFRSDLAAPWGISLQTLGVPYFHIVLSGECFVGADGIDAVKASEADIVMLPNGSQHWIADRPGRKLIPSDSAGRACMLGDPLFQKGKITNRLICGMVQFDHGLAHPILDALPEVMHFPMLESVGEIWTIVNLIDGEMAGSTDTVSRIADRLTEVLFLKLLHHYVEHNSETTGFLAALRDRRVFRALTLVHSDPAYDWTLASLGERVGMSKATLVRQFQDVVGVAPMAYIQDWRVMKAHSLVRHSSMSFEQISEATGYSSARSLSRIFKKHYGCTPNELRRSQS